MVSVKGGVTGNIHECALDGHNKFTSEERLEQSKIISTSLNLQDLDTQTVLGDFYPLKSSFAKMVP